VGGNLKSILKVCLVTGLVAGFLSQHAQAAALTIDLTWSGASFSNSASATGWMTIDTSGIPNPGDYPYDVVPNWLLDLSITVTGAVAGNGTFTLSDFSGSTGAMSWSTGGATLDFTRNLVGQPTTGNSWGTPDGHSGDLNFFDSVFSLSAPAGNGQPFILVAYGGRGEQMLLTSATPSPAPEPAACGLIGAGLGALYLARRRKRA
jgi:hypothetical protein